MKTRQEFYELVDSMQAEEGDSKVQPQQQPQPQTQRTVHTPATTPPTAEKENPKQIARHIGAKAAPVSTPGVNATGQLESERVALAAASMIPFSLAGIKNWWVWILLLTLLAIGGYFLWKRHSEKGKTTLYTNQEPETSNGYVRGRFPGALSV